MGQETPPRVDIIRNTSALIGLQRISSTDFGNSISISNTETMNRTAISPGGRHRNYSDRVCREDNRTYNVTQNPLIKCSLYLLSIFNPSSITIVRFRLHLRIIYRAPALLNLVIPWSDDDRNRVSYGSIHI